MLVTRGQRSLSPVMMVALASIVSVAAAVMVTSDAIPGFRCEETARAPLVDMPNCRMNGKTLKTSCVYKKGHPKTKFITNLKLLHQNLAPTPENGTNITLCVIHDIHTWKYKDVEISMNFSHNLVVGVVVMDRSCLHHNTSRLCARHVKLRKEVAALPNMNDVPENIDFWNFTSPLFSSQYAWLHKFTMTGHFDFAKPSSAIYGLQGTSINTFILRGDKNVPESPYALPSFVNMNFLDYLEISYHFTCTNEDFFAGALNLRFLTMKENSLETIPSNIRHLKRLTMLNLAQNKIQNFTEELFYHKQLLELVLDSNKLKQLDTFPNMPDLYMISFAHCSITTLKSHAFQNLPSLRIIDLDGNPLLHLSPLTFASLPRLQQIHMSQCSFPALPTEALGGLNLVRLTVQKNYLWTIDNLGAVGTSVRVLDIANNKIQGWDDPRMFSCTTEESQTIQDFSTNRSRKVMGQKFCFNGSWVKSLRIENNLIHTITAPMRESINVLNELRLKDNPIDCGDCGTPELQQWLKKSTVKMDNPTCKEPVWDTGTPLSLLEFDPLPCLQPLRSLLMNVVMPLLVVTSVVTAGGATLFLYRTEIAYLRHLIRIRYNTKKANTHRQNSAHTYDAFVCYSGKNRKWVLRRLVPLLERPPESYRFCLFDRDFSLGTQIVSNIVDAIDQSSKVIVVLTKHFIASKWCQWELEMANHKLFGEDREFLVLLELEPLERRRLPRLLRFLLDTRPVVRWPRPETASSVLAAAAQLRRALGPSLSQRSPPRPRANDHSAPDGEAQTFASDDRDPTVEDEAGANYSEINEHTPLLQRASPNARF